jgi:Protein kinase domain
MSVGAADQPIPTHGAPWPGRMGAVMTICGAALSLVSFFSLPYVSVLSFSVTGAQLAGPIGAVAIAAGGVVLYHHDRRTAGEPGTDQPALRERIAEVLSSAAGSPASPAAGNKPVTSSGSGHQQSEFGPYRLESLIGQGAMGQVYRAVDTARDRVVAIKLLPAQLAVDPQFRTRFQTEAALAARLREPHIVPIHDYGEIDGRLFIDMRLVEGTDLARLLAHQV